MLDLKRLPQRIHIYDPLTKTMRHTDGTLYRTRRPWRRYAKTIAAAAAIIAVTVWLLPPIIYALVDAFLLTGQTP